MAADGPAREDDPGATERAVARLERTTRELRERCPWDREQDERSIVPHTVEEAYELADAAASGDDAKLVDELGDVLFQVHFLALLLEERDAGSLAEIADAMTEKLIRRHPHVYGDSTATDSDAVLGNWDRIKREREGKSGLFEDVPEILPALLYARKHQRRAANRAPEGADTGVVGASSKAAVIARLEADLAELAAAASPADADAGPRAEPAERERVGQALGDLLFTTVELARRLHCDPELALREATGRFRAQLGAEPAEGQEPPG